MVPEGLLYTKTHEWAKKEDGNLRVGITDYAQKKLGDVVYIEFPEVGKRVRRGEPVLTVESVKSAESVYAPASGEVVEVNESLSSSPGKVNKDPYGEGWLFVLRLDDPKELEELLDASAYTKLIGEAG